MMEVEKSEKKKKKKKFFLICDKKFEMKKMFN